MELTTRRRSAARGVDRQGGLAAGLLAGAGAGLVAGVAASSPAGGRSVLALAGLAGLAIAAALTGARRVLLGLVLIDLPFQWDANLDYHAEIAARAGLGGYNVSLTTLALLGLYAIWLAQSLARDSDTPRLRLRPAALPFALLAILTLSVLVASDRSVAGFEIALIAQMLALFVYVASTVRSRQEVHFIVLLLLVGLLLNAVVSLVGYIVPGGLHVPGTASSPPGVVDPIGSRLGGTFAAPNTAGAYFAFMLALAISLCLSPVGARIRRLAIVAAVPAGIGLTLTLSRGAWIAFVVSGLVLLLGVRGQRASRVSPQAMIGAAACIIALVVPLQSVISSRLSSDDQGAAASRVPLLHLAGEMIADRPLLGVGANNFVVVLPEYAGPAYSADWLAAVHNKYLLICAESGLAALAVFLAFLWVTIRGGWRGRHNDDALLAAVALGLAAGLAGHAAHMSFDTFASRPMTETLWLAAGLIASPALAAKRRAPAARGA